MNKIANMTNSLLRSQSKRVNNKLVAESKSLKVKKNKNSDVVTRKSVERKHIPKPYIMLTKEIYIGYWCTLIYFLIKTVAA